MKICLTILFSILLGNSFAQGKFFGGNGDGFALAQTAMVLPVKLESFDVILQNNVAQISWTASAENIASFMLETSNDGNRFELLTEKAVNTNTMVPVRYGYADGPRTGLWYYRLKWQEADGAMAWSKTIAVSFSAAAQWQAFYKPGSQEVIINKPAAAALVELYGMDGKLQQVFRNYQAVFHMPVQHLPAGLYIVKIQGQKGAVRFLKL